MTTIISFYTEGTPYEQEAARLEASCIKAGVTYSITPMPNLGHWGRNCCMKPGFIRDSLKLSGKPVLWVDADAEVLLPPLLDFLRTSYDFAAHWRDGRELLSGTTWWNYTPAAIRLLDMWEDECDKAPRIWDQKHLQYSIEMVPGIRTAELPIEFTWIEDLFRPNHPKVTPIITHHQASRRLKHKV